MFPRITPVLVTWSSTLDPVVTVSEPVITVLPAKVVVEPDTINEPVTAVLPFKRVEPDTLNEPVAL